MGRLNIRRTNEKPKPKPKPKATAKPNTPLPKKSTTLNIISDSDILKNKIRELINIHAKKNIYSGISDIKNKLTAAVINDLMYH